MSDPTPRDNGGTAPTEPTAVAPVAAASAPAEVKSRWYGRRVPLLVAGAALILGCLLGGGVVAITAFAVDGQHGGDRGGHSSRDERADGRANGGSGRHDGNRDRNGRNGDDQPTPAPSASSSPAPTPSASA